MALDYREVSAWRAEIEDLATRMETWTKANRVSDDHPQVFQHVHLSYVHKHLHGRVSQLRKMYPQFVAEPSETERLVWLHGAVLLVEKAARGLRCQSLLRVVLRGLTSLEVLIAAAIQPGDPDHLRR